MVRRQEEKVRLGLKRKEGTWGELKRYREAQKKPEGGSKQGQEGRVEPKAREEGRTKHKFHARKPSTKTNKKIK